MEEQGLSLSMGEFGVQVFDEMRGNNRGATEAVVSWARQVLGGPDRPTAVFCHGAAMARSVIAVALEMGLRIPGDLSVVSWGSPWTARNAYPRLTTLAVDFARITVISSATIRLWGNGEPAHYGERLDADLYGYYSSEADGQMSLTDTRRAAYGQRSTQR